MLAVIFPMFVFTVISLFSLYYVASFTCSLQVL
nr:MAG TPA: hypothetical protein [Caudoviricetes sp.]